MLFTDVHGFALPLTEQLLSAISGSGNAVGERTFKIIMCLLSGGAAEENRHAEGAAALLMPWMGSLAALLYLPSRMAEFEQLRQVCRERSQAIYDRIDKAVTVPVLEELARVGEGIGVPSLRQDDEGLLPKFKYLANEKTGQTTGGNTEIFCAMSIALVGLAVDGIFQADIQQIFGQIAKKVHGAPSKTFGRMFNKLNNKADHGDDSIPKPRPARNVDVIRAGIEVSKWQQVEEALSILQSKYRILRVKNSHDPHVPGFGGYRSVLVNFAYDTGLRFSEVFGNTCGFDQTQAKFVVEESLGQRWLDYVSSLHQPIDWKWGLVGLCQASRRQDATIVMSAEVQIIYEPYMAGRSLSHLLFKISRCETGPDEMVRDFAHGYAQESTEKARLLATVRVIAGEARAAKGTDVRGDP